MTFENQKYSEPTSYINSFMFSLLAIVDPGHNLKTQLTAGSVVLQDQRENKGASESNGRSSNTFDGPEARSESSVAQFCGCA